MNSAKIKTMSADECMKAIRLLDAKADVEGRAATKTETALIEKLRNQIHEVDPDSED